MRLGLHRDGTGDLTITTASASAAPKTAREAAGCLPRPEGLQRIDRLAHHFELITDRGEQLVCAIVVQLGEGDHGTKCAHLRVEVRQQ